MKDEMARGMNVAMFEENVWFCERTKELLSAIEASRENTMVYGDADLRVSTGRLDESVLTCNLQILENGASHKKNDFPRSNMEGRIGIVYFGSACYPGGNAIRGGCGGEEYLCRTSTLYPCLNTEFVRKEYYDRNLRESGMHGAMQGESNCYLYIPDVLCTEKNAREDIWWRYGNSFDVIVCGRQRECTDRDVANICAIARQNKIDGLIFLLEQENLSQNIRNLCHM